MNVVQNDPTLKWVKLRKYCELSGETRSSVYAKRKRGIWREGAQCRVGPDGNLWINLMEVERWVEHGQGNLRCRSA